MKHETQREIVKSDITPPQKICVKELHSRLQEEESLNSFENNLDEHFENGLSP